jgi:hypothetical protein
VIGVRVGLWWRGGRGEERGGSGEIGIEAGAGIGGGERCGG